MLQSFAVLGGAIATFEVGIALLNRFFPTARRLAWLDNASYALVKLETNSATWFGIGASMIFTFISVYNDKATEDAPIKNPSSISQAFSRNNGKSGISGLYLCCSLGMMFLRYNKFYDSLTTSKRINDVHACGRTQEFFAAAAMTRQLQLQQQQHQHSSSSPSSSGGGGGGGMQVSSPMRATSAAGLAASSSLSSSASCGAEVTEEVATSTTNEVCSSGNHATTVTRCTRCHEPVSKHFNSFELMKLQRGITLQGVHSALKSAVVFVIFTLHTSKSDKLMMQLHVLWTAVLVILACWGDACFFDPFFARHERRWDHFMDDLRWIAYSGATYMTLQHIADHAPAGSLPHANLMAIFMETVVLFATM